MSKINFQFPLVSVIIPAYNAEAFIERTLNSVLGQTYNNLEVLVVDDGSKDKTFELVQSIAQKDSRVTLIQQKNAGVATARNLAIEKSQGEYIAPIDADDIWYPSKIEKQVKCILEAGESVGLVYSLSANIDENDLIIGQYSDNFIFKPEGKVYTALLCTNFVGNASTPLIRRTCFKHIGGYNYQLKQEAAQGCEDWDMYLRIAEYYEFRVVPEFLVGYRQVIGSMAGNYKSMVKSYNLVMADVQRIHPAIPVNIYRLSNTFYYNYLLGKVYASGAHWSTLLCLFKTVKSDWATLVRPGVYIMIVVCLIKIAVNPITSLIWSNHRSWVEFKHNLIKNRSPIKIEKLNNQVNTKEKKIIWKPYDLILLKRLNTIRQLSEVN
ncbi:glycosyltransferase family 2 protein [Synechocystis sp. PCC 7509]|uniref:glycosyltransferase family 2 protein n=1 Tax=Synechocystis sp. PCC 7509 TaxID=927677 RepID=UPI0002AC2A26|nr:glycosyltransferase family 2 protein [Synechocystis sp. PCC 7509]